MSTAQKMPMGDVHGAKGTCVEGPPGAGTLDGRIRMTSEEGGTQGEPITETGKLPELSRTPRMVWVAMPMASAN
jgi:hypothetical protein